MTISKEVLLKRKEDIVTDYNKLVEEIGKGEGQIKVMKDNLNALAGALQQVEMFVKQIEDDGDPMPEEKRQALEMATS
jgi:archaellum component FlaC